MSCSTAQQTGNKFQVELYCCTHSPPKEPVPEDPSETGSILNGKRHDIFWCFLVATLLECAYTMFILVSWSADHIQINLSIYYIVHMNHTVGRCAIK